VEGRELEVLYYKTALDVYPFREWRSRIVDDNTRAAIDARIARFRGGNFGYSRSLGGGVSESKIDFGPGYRIYYGVDGNKIVLLCAVTNRRKRPTSSERKDTGTITRSMRKNAKTPNKRGGGRTCQATTKTW
jgi:putative addiction module killer protein